MTIMTTIEKKSYVDTSASSKVLKDDFCGINGYLEQKIETYKHLQDTLSVLEGIVDVLDVVTKDAVTMKINNICNYEQKD